MRRKAGSQQCVFQPGCSYSLLVARVAALCYSSDRFARELDRHPETDMGLNPRRFSDVTKGTRRVPNRIPSRVAECFCGVRLLKLGLGNVELSLAWRESCNRTTEQGIDSCRSEWNYDLLSSLMQSLRQSDPIRISPFFLRFPSRF